MKPKLNRRAVAFVVFALLSGGCAPRESPVSEGRTTVVGTDATAERSTVTPLPTLALPARTAEQTLDEQLEKLAPRTAGVAQVEVVETKEIDMRPGDGPLYLEVRFRVLRKTGAVADKIQIIKAHGGLRPYGSPPPKLGGPVKLDTFKRGLRYWVAFCSPYDRLRCPQGVVESWPDAVRPELLEQAIETDHYRDQPLYDPDNGLTHGSLAAEDGRSWRVRMERDGALLWEVSLPGEKYRNEHGGGMWRFIRREHWPDELKDAAGAGWFLFAETAVDLKAENEYSLAAGKYRVVYVLEADTGRTAAVRVSRFDVSPMSTAKIVRYFDAKTEEIRREVRSENR